MGFILPYLVNTKTTKNEGVLYCTGMLNQTYLWLPISYVLLYKSSFFTILFIHGQKLWEEGPGTLYEKFKGDHKKFQKFFTDLS